MQFQENRMRRWSRGSSAVALTVVMGLAVTLSACKKATIGPVDDPDPALSAFSISIANPSLVVGGTTTVIPSAVRAGNSVSVTYEYESTNRSVATVDGGGTITAVGAGSASITASATGRGAGFKDAKLTSSAAINVSTPPPALIGLTVAPTPAAMVVGEAPLQLVPTPVRASTSVVVAYTYSSNTPTVATVNPASGAVTAVGQGNAVITVTGTGSGAGFTTNSLTATSSISVSPAPPCITAINFQPITVQVNVGSQQQIVVSAVQPAGAPSATITFGTNSPATATVQPTGVVTGVSAGSAVITVTATCPASASFSSNTVSQLVPVTINALPPALIGFTVSPTNPSLSAGQALTLTLNPVRANPSVSVGYTYISNNPTVASVNTATGTISALAAGTAMITVTATGSGTGFTTNSIPATAQVSVSQGPPSLTALSVTPALDTLSVDQTRALVPNATRASAAVSVTYSYSTSASSVATVSNTGIVTAVAPGTATITVRADGSGTGFSNSTLFSTSTIVVMNACDRRRVIVLGQPVSGRVDDASCRDDRELYRYSLNAQSRVRFTLTQGTAAATIAPLFQSDLLGWGSLLSLDGSISAVVPAGTWNAYVASDIRPNDFTFTTTVNPADDCNFLITATGVSNASLVFNNTCGTRTTGTVTYAFRRLYIMPALGVGQTVTVSASAAAFPVRVDIYNVTGQTLATATAPAAGGLASVPFTSTISQFVYAEVSNRQQPGAFGNVSVSISGPSLTSITSALRFENLPSLVIHR
jgi:uncharacterized protein YjdB